MQIIRGPFNLSEVRKRSISFIKFHTEMTIVLRERVHERLKKQGKLRKITLEDLALHSTAEKAWISVQGAVYDITEHVKRHAGWKCGCAVSELIAILRCLGK